mgnify:CR=1 FL=1
MVLGAQTSRGLQEFGGARNHSAFALHRLEDHRADVLAALVAAALAGQLPASLLFVGPRGVGKTTTARILARALNCASCHVGDGDRDMNHDMIAAGHPRLAFETARFHHQPDYRTHWTEKGNPRDFEVRLWVVGQAATLRAAANLLAERAAKAQKNEPSHPWPEFSGYSCYACHQGIGDPELKGQLSDTSRPVGVPGWEVWSNAAARVAVESCGLAFPGISSPKLTEVAKLRTLMESRRAPAAGDVIAQARAAVAELDTFLAELQAAEDRGAGAVSVNNSAALGGTGSIAGAVNLNNTSRLAPGASGTDHRYFLSADVVVATFAARSTS